MKHLAFTGTQRGMTPVQRTRWRNVVAGLLPDVFHHGDCIGADAEAHDDVVRTAAIVHIHPSTRTDKRAFCTPCGEMSIPLPPLDRNRVMVDDCEALIACPGAMVEELRSGTWATIRYARRQRKPVHIIWPDGSYVAPPSG